MYWKATSQSVSLAMLSLPGHQSFFLMILMDPHLDHWTSRVSENLLHSAHCVSTVPFLYDISAIDPFEILSNAEMANNL